MICGICLKQEGEPLTFIAVELDGTRTGCLCYVCHPVRCKPCQKIWAAAPARSPFTCDLGDEMLS